MRGVSNFIKITIVLTFVGVTESLNNKTKESERAVATTINIRDEKELKQTLLKLNFQDLFRNKTMQKMLDPTLQKRYWETLVETSNLVDLVDEQRVLTMMRPNGGNVPIIDLLRDVLACFEPLRSLYNTDWSQLKAETKGMYAL